MLRELHGAYGAAFFKRLAATAEQSPAPKDLTEASQAFQEFFGTGEIMVEPIFYGGSGAFDFQYWDLAPRRYRLDEDWITANKGVSMDAAAEIVVRLKRLKEPSLTKEPKDFAELCEAVLDMFCFEKADLSDDPPEVREAFLAAFSLEPGLANGSLTEPGQYNELESHPLIHLKDEKYFMPVHFNLSRSLYESPFYWMYADEGYRDTAASHRGETTEELAAAFLEPVFGAENVHRGVELRRGGTVVGEIDVLAVLGTKAFVVQCKAKRLTELARLGDTARLKGDFEAAVQSAYNQGVSCRSLLADSDIAATSASGVVIETDFSDAFIACVVSDHYPALTHQVATYLNRGTDDRYSIALSLFDLEIMAFYLANPFEFMYYVRQRTQLADYFRSEEEISLLAYHLRNKLFRIPSSDLIAVDSGLAQLIDANYPVMRGEVPHTPAAERLHHDWKNERFDELMNDLQASGEPGFVDAAFLLYDFSGDSADQIIDWIEQTKKRSAADGEKHSMATMSDEGGLGVSFVSRADSPELLDVDVLAYAQAKKYRERAVAWLGLGSMADSPRLADVMVFNADPWQEDEELEAIAEEVIGVGTMRRRPKIGRNDPCYCGSGVKFKRCHGR